MSGPHEETRGELTAAQIDIDRRVDELIDPGEPVSAAAIAHRLGLAWDEAEAAASRLAERRSALTADPGYDAEVADELCRRMHVESGQVDLENPLANLLYVLARDVVAVSVLEELADQLAAGGWPRKATNGWLAGWANWTAGRIADGG